MATREEIAAVVRTGIIARRKGDLNEAGQQLNKAAGMCGPDHSYELAVTLRELGELARHNHNLSGAQAHYEQAVALLRGSADRLKYAHTIRHLGDVHAERQQWPDAERCFVEALNVYRSHPSPDALDLANAIRPYALLMTTTGRREEARALWVEAGELYESLGIAAGVEECRRQAEQLA